MISISRISGFITAVTFGLFALSAVAQDYTLYSNRSPADMTESVNANAIGIVGGTLGGTYVEIINDLATVLNNDESLRIVPILGSGSVQNVVDILHLRGVDVGIVQSDVIAFMRDKRILKNVNYNLRYITKLYNEDVHIVARKEIKSLGDLAGKKVNFRPPTTGTHLTATNLFDVLGIEVEQLTVKHKDAVELVKRGEIAATIRVAGKPASWVEELKPEDNLHLLPVPYVEGLSEHYLPAVLTHEDYPDLIPVGKQVKTVAVAAVLAVYNWQSSNSRYRKVSNFIDQFFSKIERFKEPGRHKRWEDVNLNAEVPGWKRFVPAAKWLNANIRARQNSVQTNEFEEAELKTKFQQFVQTLDDQNYTQAELDELFENFKLWKSAE